MFDRDKALELIKTRRSTRAYTGEPVSQQDLEAVLEAGRYAPSGGNSQTTHFIVITEDEDKAEIAALAERLFAAMEVKPDTYRSMAASINASKKGGYVFHRNAPVLILTANSVTYSNNIADCSCALENMMIMANALDLGSCWVNQIKWLNDAPEMVELLRRFGMDGGETVYGGLVLGHPATEDGMPERQPLKRTGNRVTFVR